METSRREALAVLSKHEARIETWLRIRGIPSRNIPDLRQMVYERALEYLKDREITSAVGGLLRRITQSVVADYCETAAIQARAMPRLMTEEESVKSPEQDLIERQIKADLDAIIATFDARSQEVLRAKFVDELSPEEIAESLHISLSTVKRDLAAAMQACLVALKKKGHHLALMPLLAETLVGGEEVGGKDAGSSRSPARTGEGAPGAPSKVPFALPANLLPNGGVALGGAAAGGFLVYLLMRGPALATHLPPIVFETIAVEGRTIPAGIWETRQEIVCPAPAVVGPPAAPSPPSYAAPAVPKSDARPRLLAQAAIRALERGDIETAKMYAAQLSGPFRVEVDAAIARAMSR